MKKKKWYNFFGSLLATSTLFTVKHSANHMRKKYGLRKENMFLSDIKNIVSYSFDKFLFQNSKIMNWVNSYFHISDL